MGKMRRLAGFSLLIGTILVAQNAKQVPSFKVDPPKPLPNRWLVGAVAGVALESKDHV
jgi:predicted membrane protein